MNVVSKSWQHLKRLLFRRLRPRNLFASTENHGARARLLVLGIYLSDKRNTAQHIVRELGKSEFHNVTQRWARIGALKGAEPVESVTVLRKTEPAPKFEILNELLRQVDIDEYDALMVVDDDIILPRNFVDAYISAQKICDFSLSQPARTRSSWISHEIVSQRKGVLARQTRFVEIGPVFVIRSDVFDVLLPFEVTSPMGWGIDFVWPVLVQRKGKRMGIIDAVPVNHSIRRPFSFYDKRTALDQQERLFCDREHLTKEQAFTGLSTIMFP